MVTLAVICLVLYVIAVVQQVAMERSGAKFLNWSSVLCSFGFLALSIWVVAAGT